MNSDPYKPPASNLVERLRYWSEQQSAEIAFYFLDERDKEFKLTYQAVDRQSRAIAARLSALGMSGQRALLLYPPGIEFVTAFFGCLYSGTVAVPAFAPRRNRKAERIESISDDAQAAIVLTVQKVADRSRDHLEVSPRLRDLTWLSTDEVPLSDADDWRAPALSDNTLAVLQYTSGSTGLPKGVMLSHGNLMHNCASIMQGFEVSCDAIGLSWLPTYHDMGLVGGVLKPVYCGRPSVLMSPMAFLQRPVRWLRGITRYRVTISGGPNFAYAICNERISSEECQGLDLSSWDVAFNGAEPIRAETLAEFTEKFAPYGFRPETHYPCYGMAETTLIVTGVAKQNAPVVRAFDAKSLEEHRVTLAHRGEPSARTLVGCGRALLDQRVIIVDPKTRLRLPDDRVGEIWTSSPSVGQGYWNRPEETDRTFRARLADSKNNGAYLRTGDLGFLHDGELFVTGRSKDLIIIRGRNLHPHDIEASVGAAHEALRSGGSAAFSIDKNGEEQLVILQEVERDHREFDADEVIAAIREAMSRDHEVSPSTVVLLRAAKLRKTSSGKVQRRACRDDFIRGDLDFLVQWRQGGKAETAVEIPSASQPQTARQSQAAIQAWLVDRIAERLKTAPARIDVNESFAKFGLDSMALVQISGELEHWLDCSVSPTLLFNYPTVAALAEYLAATEATGAQDAVGPTKHSEPIAIVGLGCRFPRADGPDEFWRLLRDGADALADVPGNRWDVDEYFDPNPETPGKMYSRRGGFLQQVDQFDPQFFGMAPREAQTLDPQQRLLMEVCWETLEDAGQDAARLEGSATGVFVGISNGDYARIQSRSRELNTIDAHTGTGTLNSVAAGRIAHFLGLHGPTMAIDTACSSSLVAVHLAVQALRNGDCRAALAGGVNLILDPSTSIALSAMRALSPDGRCKTFDEDADGYVRGEGCGMVLLKSVADALEDGDRILALIRGSSVNHDGHSNGLTAPHGPSQESVIRRALADADVDRDLITYVEAHGTGTSLGDPIEVQALDGVFRGDRPADSPIAIGSVKTNIGHLESAAGIASLIKVVLSLRHEQIPPHLHFEKPNPYIAWDQIPLTVPTQPTPWPAMRGRRIAGVSSFGFSGTNAHLIVEQAPEPREAPPGLQRPQHLLVLSAKSNSALQDLARSYQQQLTSDAADLGNICYTAAVGRSHFAHRLAVLGNDRNQCRNRLEAVCAGRFASGTADGTVDTQNPPRIAFLFTGQGSQYVGMGRSLYETQPTFRRVLDECDQILRDELEMGLLDVVYAAGEADPLLHTTAYTQPALFSIEYALYKLWTSWGIQPSIVFGHSVGEYVAACAAGVLSMKDGLELVAARGRLMQTLPQGGAMAAIAAKEEDVQALIADCTDVSIAALNGPEQTVVSGAATSVQNIVRKLASKGIRSQPLEVSHAFHSELMEPILDEFEHVCRGVAFSAPKLPIVTNVHGRSVSEEIATADYWRQQIRQPVRFAEGIAEIGRMGADVFLEIGPKPILTAMGRQCIEHREQLWLPSLRVRQEDWTVMLQSLAELYVRGAAIDWQGFDRDYPRRKVSLPKYPFQRKRYWLDESRDWRAAGGSQVRGSEQAGPPDIEQAFSEIQWQPKSLLNQSLERRHADYIPTPLHVAEVLRPETDRLRSQLSLERYQTLARELDKLSVAYIRDALSELGCRRPYSEMTPLAGPSTAAKVRRTSLSVGEPVSTDKDARRTQDFADSAKRPIVRSAVELADRLGVVDQQRSLFFRMLRILEEEESPARRSGESVRDGMQPNSCESGYERPPQSAAEGARPADPALLCSSLLEQFPECSAELNLLHQCGQHLAKVLTGETDPLHVLFPSGSSKMVEALYADSPFARTLNTLVEETVAELLRQLPQSRSVKVLEIGAGTGGTTSQILARLPAGRTEYVFTDVSEVFTQGAKQKFRRFPFVRYGVLDIERDPRQQGFADHQFDLILAANVLHATADLRRTVAHVQQLLAPRGALVLLEGTRPQRWLDLIFGLTDGWWRFADRDLRPTYPLLSADRWTDLLRQEGFESAVALPPQQANDATSAAPPQVVILAKNGSAPDTTCQAECVAECADVGSWLIFADAEAVGQQLSEQLTARGGNCVQVLRGPTYRQLDENRFSIRVDQPNDLRQAIDVAWQTGRPACRGVVHLWSLDAPSADETSVAGLDRARSLGCVSVLHALQAIYDARFGDSPRFYLVTRGAQAVGEPSPLRGLAQSPLWGFGRVLAEEQPTMWGGLIDLDSAASSEQTATSLLHEILQSDGEDQVAYRRDQRFAARLIRNPTTGKATRPVRWRVDASYLISGGLGDLGLITARWMVEQGARTLILFGRSPFPPRKDWDSIGKQDNRQAERFAAIRDLEARGARIKVASADVADEASLSALLSEIEAEGWPPIRGVVHAAGIAEAQTLLELDAGQLDRVLRPKVAGAWLLHHLLVDARLDFFVSFSSGAALLGSPMLGSYGAANAFLDALAHHRHASGLPALTVNWGFWDEVGMVARSQRDIGRGFAPRGMQSFSPQQGLTAMQRLLEQGATQAAVMPVDWEVWGESHPRAFNAPLLSHVRQQEVNGSADRQADDSDDALNRKLVFDAAPEARPRLLEEFLSRQLSRVLRIPLDDLDVNQPLNNLGIDSLMAVELRNQVQAQLAIMLPVASLLQNPSIAQLAQILLDQLTTSDHSAPAMTAGSAGTDLDGVGAGESAHRSSASETLANLDQLSDDEVDEMLNKMMN